MSGTLSGAGPMVLSLACQHGGMDIACSMCRGPWPDRSSRRISRFTKPGLLHYQKRLKMRHLTLSPLVLLLLAGPANAQTTDDRSWHMMQKRYDGSVVAEGLTTTMTKHECEFARARILGLPATDEEKKAETARKEAAQKDRDEFRKSHLECNTDPPPTNKVACWGFMLGTPNGSSTTMHMMNEIASAECFQ